MIAVTADPTVWSRLRASGFDAEMLKLVAGKVLGAEIARVLNT